MCKQNVKEVRHEFTWFFSGENQQRDYLYGVGVVIKNNMLKYVHNVIPCSDRHMVIQLRLYSSLLVNIINSLYILLRLLMFMCVA